MIAATKDIGPTRRVGAVVFQLVGRVDVAESGRPGRPELLAKRPHNKLRRLSAELQNVGDAAGKLGEAPTL